MNAAEQICISLLKNCKTLNAIKQVHSYSIKTGLISDPLIAGRLLLHAALLVPDSLHYAHRLLHHFPNPDTFMYNTLIRGFSDSGSPQNSLTTFIDMCRNSTVNLDSFSFAFILKAVANLRCLNVGSQLHCRAIEHGVDGNLFVGTTVISMYAECGCVEFAKKVFEEMSQPNIISWNAIITACFRCFDVKGVDRYYNRMPFKNLTSNNIILAGYMKFGELVLAKKLFFEMPMKDEVSWSTMIVGFSQSGCFDEAFGFFRELVRVGLGTNEASLTGVLSACAQAGAFEIGKILHGYVVKAGFVWMSSVNNALLDTYSKCGKVDMARLVFERMPGERTIVSWTSMMAGLAMQGYGEDAVTLFQDMVKSGIRPDGITFISLLYACSHAGMIEKGCDCFNMMKNIYGIEPAVEHYGCMVDLYGRAGHLKKAYDFVIQMPIQPNAIIWRTLLGACSIHGYVELAEEVRKRLAELEPNNSSDHVLLSNIYAVAGKWKDVTTVRRSMTSQKLKKAPGWSMIEVDKIMYSFVAGEKLTKITEEAYSKLGEIMLKLRVEGGYIPEVGGVLHDIEEEEKENSVLKHSEKLAVAFGMSRLCKGRAIRVVKNLRVCKDCHTMMKVISKIYQTEIVLRDRSRFHTFRDGYCSCKDYW